MRRALAILLFLLAGSVEAQRKGQFIVDYPLDATSYTYCAATNNNGQVSTMTPIPGAAAIKTTGSSAAVTAVTALTSPFANVAANDILAVRRNDGSTDLRRVTVRTDADNVTVASVVDWSDGFGFGYYDVTCGTGAESGWAVVSGAETRLVEWHVKQLVVTGGIDVRVQGRNRSLDSQPITLYPDPANSASTDECKKGNFTAVNSCSLVVTGAYDQLRIGFKIGTSDDAITITAGVNDDIDATEGDAGAGVATLTAATYTSSTTLCAEIVTQLDALAGANTYSCTYSSTTRKFTLARATGAATISFPWTTGPNVATSAAATLGFTADDAGSTTYTADNAVNIDEGTSEESISASVTVAGAIR